MTESNSMAVWIPMYNSAGALESVVEELASITWPTSMHFFFIDNCSTDESQALANAYIKKFSLKNAAVYTNTVNLGLGGSQKQAFRVSKLNGFKYVAIFHSDFQPVASDLHKMCLEFRDSEIGAALGARFMPGSRRQEYGFSRYMGNLILNIAFSLRFRKMVWDLGSGLNIYEIEELVFFEDLPNDLSFNCNLLARSLKEKKTLCFYPILWRKGLAPSSLKSVKLGLQTLKSTIKVGSEKHVLDYELPRLVKNID